MPPGPGTVDNLVFIRFRNWEEAMRMDFPVTQPNYSLPGVYKTSIFLIDNLGVHIWRTAIRVDKASLTKAHSYILFLGP